CPPSSSARSSTARPARSPSRSCTSRTRGCAWSRRCDMPNGLEKATLLEINAANNQAIGDEIPVQFNPASLRLQITNQTEGNRQRGRQRRQYVGQSSSKLTLQLVYDTADESDGGDNQPRSVRERTRDVEKFVVPTRQGNRQTVPKLRFHWGDFVFEGIMDSLTID